MVSCGSVSDKCSSKCPHGHILVDDDLHDVLWQVMVGEAGLFEGDAASLLAVKALRHRLRSQ